MSVGPAATSSAELAEACEEFVTSVVLGSDIVPRLSYYTVDALLDELSKKSPALSFAANIRRSFIETIAPLTRPSDASDAAAAARRNDGASGAGTEELEMVTMLERQSGAAAQADSRGSLAALTDAAKSVGGGPTSSAHNAVENASNVLARVPSSQSTTENGKLFLEVPLPPPEDVPNHDAALDSDTDAASMAELSDGMALGVGKTGVAVAPIDQRDGDGPLAWTRWLEPVKSLAPLRFGADSDSQEGGPFSTDALAARTRAAKERSKAEAASAETAAGEPPLRDLSVGDPVRYLREAGLNTEKALSDVSPAPELDGAPSGVLQMDQDVIAEADAGHQAAEAATAPPPPPVYPAGRIIWLLPVEQSKDMGQPVVVSSTRLPSTRTRFASHDIFPHNPVGRLEAGPPDKEEADEDEEEGEPEEWELRSLGCHEDGAAPDEETEAATAAAEAAGRAEAEAFAGKYYSPPYHHWQPAIQCLD